MAREDLLEAFLTEARAKINEAVADSDFDDPTKAKVQGLLEDAVSGVDTSRLQAVVDRGQQAMEEDAEAESAKQAEAQAAAGPTAATTDVASSDSEEEEDPDDPGSTSASRRSGVARRRK